MLSADEATTRACIGAILAFLKQHHGRFDFTKLTSSIAGLDDLISEAEDDDTIPQIPKPQPGIPTSPSEGAAPAAGSPPVAPTTSSGSPSGVFGLIVTLFQLLGIFAIIKQLLSLVPIVGQPAVRLVEGIEDGSISDGKLEFCNYFYDDVHIYFFMKSIFIESHHFIFSHRHFRCRIA